jgi:hypothetical protein
MRGAFFGVAQAFQPVLTQAKACGYNRKRKGRSKFLTGAALFTCH